MKKGKLTKGRRMWRRIRYHMNRTYSLNGGHFIMLATIATCSIVSSQSGVVEGAKSFAQFNESTLLSSSMVKTMDDFESLPTPEVSVSTITTSCPVTTVSETTSTTTTEVTTITTQEPTESSTTSTIVEDTYFEETDFEVESSAEEEESVEEDIVPEQSYESDKRYIPIEDAYGLASMMAHEGGSSEVTCIRTGIGFMNRIDHPLCGTYSVNDVLYSGAYLSSTPDSCHIEWAEYVISQWNAGSENWSSFCAEYNLTDRVIFHHNGTSSSWFEYPVFVEYGDTGWYSWVLTYSEHSNYHY